jgi:hypothetical protein
MIDDLVGATVRRIEVTASGTLRLYFKPTSGQWTSEDWNPLMVRIPPEPKKRKARR